MDDFDTKSEGTTEEELRAGLEIFEQVGIKTSVFIPPQWKLSSGSIEVLEKLGFSLVKMPLAPYQTCHVIRHYYDTIYGSR